MGKKEKQKKKNGASVQAFLGVKSFSEYGLLTNGGELLFFHVTPSNISVLSSASVEIKVHQLTVVLSTVPDIEIVCLDSAERFDGNKAHLVDRMENEQNPKVKELLKKDVAFLDEIQMEMATARRFLFIARCRNLNPVQTFNRANAIQKVISEQGFDTHRMTKAEIKRFLALYFESSSFGEQMPDFDGEQYLQEKVDKKKISEEKAERIRTKSLDYTMLTKGCGIKHLDVVSTVQSEVGRFVQFNGAVVGIKTTNYNKQFVGRTYMTITYSNGESQVFYASVTDNARSVAEVAELALTDTCALQTNQYKYLINGAYCWFDETGLSVLNGFIGE